MGSDEGLSVGAVPAREVRLDGAFVGIALYRGDDTWGVDYWNGEHLESSVDHVLASPDDFETVDEHAVMVISHALSEGAATARRS
jgi:hypothetical protein